LRYHVLDVFTDQPFSGNPLAVFVDPGSLSDGQMQRIASELNLSETVFAWSPAGADRQWPTRIFTPAVELPFAGHPTVGTGFLLAALGFGDGDRHVAVELDERVGLVPVTVTLDDAGVPTRAEFVVPVPASRLPCASADELAAVLGLEPENLHPLLPVAGFSSGVPFSIVPVRDVAALGRASVQASEWNRVCAGREAPNLFVITPLDQPGAEASRWRARMFAPAMGITEDPATGSAAAAFAGYLDAATPPSFAPAVTIEQGVEMGRPSSISVTIATDASRTVRVGGGAVVVGVGTLAVPPPLA
jgi:trans-2,3-dihydro-3-hydroxyanthranilate isomerase